MQEQANPRRAATSVSDYYERAYERVFVGLIGEHVPGMFAAPTWEESALCSMLDDLVTARRERLERHDRVMAQSREEVTTDHKTEILAHVDRIGRVAAEIAAINTLLHWGWIRDERLVKIGAQLLGAAGVEE